MFSKCEVDFMVSKYKTDKLSLESIASIFSCSRGSIRKALAIRGENIRKPSDIIRCRIGYDSKDLDRFWSKVQKGLNNNECWEWQANRDNNGYGRFGHRYKLLSAHRVAWEIENGPIPKDLCVLHRCDNPSCVNISHLFLGTHKDNMKDRDQKGRSRGGSLKGETNPSCKHKDCEVTRIKEMAKMGYLQKDIIKKLGLSQSYVSGVMTYIFDIF